MDEKVRSLLQGPNFAHIATARPDGSASVTPTWVDLDGEDVLLNSMPGRAWVQNATRDPRITVSVSALDNPYECATIRGHALAPDADGAEEHFRRLFQQYRNRPLPGGDGAADDGEPGRVLIRVVVDAISYQWQPGPGATAEYDEYLAHLMAG